MYVQWADRCGMHLERLDTQDGAHFSPSPVSAAARSSEQRSGVHVLEHVDEERDGSPVVDRDQVHVVVVARPSHAGSRSDDVVHAARYGDREGAEAPSVIVRRYRPGKAPLVRDSVREYRTGRLDRVLAGDFDLY